MKKSKAKDKAWTAFSKFIRMRDCLATTGDPDRGICITCDREFPFKQLQAGHFVGGRGNAVLFDERIVNAQCRHCNAKPPIGLGGNYARYALVMLDRYGREEVERMLNLKHQTKIYKINDLLEIEETYKKKLLTF